MDKLVVIGLLFVVAGLCEIGGGYTVGGGGGRRREPAGARSGGGGVAGGGGRRVTRPVAWALLGALILVAYGVVAALQPISEFGRVYAAYGGDVHRAGVGVGRGGGRLPARPARPARR